MKSVFLRLATLLLVCCASNGAFANIKCSTSFVYEVYSKDFRRTEKLDLYKVYSEAKGKRIDLATYLSLVSKLTEDLPLEKLKKLVDLMITENRNQIQLLSGVYKSREERLMDVYVRDTDLLKKPLDAILAVLPGRVDGMRVGVSRDAVLRGSLFDPQFNLKPLIEVQENRLPETIRSYYYLKFRSPVIKKPEDLYSVINSTLFSLHSVLFYRNSNTYSLLELYRRKKLEKYYKQVVKNTLLVVESDLNLKKSYIKNSIRSLRDVFSKASLGVGHIKDHQGIRSRLQVSPLFYLMNTTNYVSKPLVQVSLLFALNGLGQFFNSMNYFDKELAFQDGLNQQKSEQLNRMIDRSFGKDPEALLEELSSREFDEAVVKKYLENLEVELGFEKK